jgi:NAD(P)-dependent dehydrogenase (short-subunit alcohol dehydrogenase family)
MLPSFSLKDHTVLLTGAAGLFGRGLASALAEAGATLIIASRSADKLQAVAEEETARGHRVFAEAFDQGDEASILALKSRIEEKCGPLHGLVNNSVLRPMKGASGRTPCGSMPPASCSCTATSAPPWLLPGAAAL